MERRLGDGQTPAMLLDAAGFRVVVLRDGEPGRLYQVHGRLWEDRHGMYLTGEDEVNACTNVGAIEEVWTIPTRLTSVNGIDLEVDAGPGTSVTRVDRSRLEDLTVRLKVRLRPSAQVRSRMSP